MQVKREKREKQNKKKKKTESGPRGLKHNVRCGWRCDLIG